MAEWNAPLPDEAVEGELTHVEDHNKIVAAIEELRDGVGTVPIFPTLAEAQAWEAENPGKVALTIEPSATDTTPPSWSAILTVKSVGSTQIVINASAAATDDRGVMYEVSQDGM